MNQDNLYTELTSSANQQPVNPSQSLTITLFNSSKRKKLLKIVGIIALALLVLVLIIWLWLTTNRKEIVNRAKLSNIKNSIILIKEKEIWAIEPANPANKQLIYETKDKTKDEKFLSVKWSPDRKKIAYAKRIENCQIYLPSLGWVCYELGIISMDTMEAIVVDTVPFYEQSLFYDWKNSSTLIYCGKNGGYITYNLDKNNKSLIPPIDLKFEWNSTLDLREEYVYIYSTSQEQTDINQPPDYNAPQQYYIGKINIENPVKFEKIFNLNNLNN